MMRRTVGRWLATALATAGLVIGLAAGAGTERAEAAPWNPNYGLGSCAWMNYSVGPGSTGDCVAAVQLFIRVTINGRGYGPLCESAQAQFPAEFSRPIDITGEYNAQTAAYIRCYQEMVTRYANQGIRYPSPLTIDGVAGRQTYLMMLHTCRHDDQFITDEGVQGRFSSMWFCVR